MRPRFGSSRSLALAASSLFGVAAAATYSAQNAAAKNNARGKLPHDPWANVDKPLPNRSDMLREIAKKTSAFNTNEKKTKTKTKTKKTIKKQGVVEHRGKIRKKKKKNFDSVLIEPITIVKTKTRGGKHTFFLGPRTNLPTRAEYIYIYKGRGSKCTRNITASTPRLSLVLLRLRR